MDRAWWLETSFVCCVSTVGDLAGDLFFGCGVAIWRCGCDEIPRSFSDFWEGDCENDESRSMNDGGMQYNAVFEMRVLVAWALTYACIFSSISGPVYP